MNVTEHNTHGLVPSKLSISPNVENNLVTENGQMLSFYLFIDSKVYHKFFEDNFKYYYYQA